MSTKHDKLKTGEKLWVVNCALSIAALSLTMIAFSGGFFPAMMSDEWRSLSFLVDNGFWHSIACRHNGHPMLFPNLVYRVLLLASDGNALVRSLATFVSAAAAAALLGLAAARCIRSAGDSSKLQAVAIILATVALSLWLTGHAKLFWGMSVHDYIVIGTGVAALLLTPRISNAGQVNYSAFGGVVLLATVCTFSFGFGAAVWGAVLIVMLMSRQRFAPMVLIVVAALTTTVVAHVYLPNCDSAAETLSRDIDLQPSTLVLSVCGMLGNTMMHSLTAWIKPEIQLAAIVGALGITALVFYSGRIYYLRMNSTYITLVGCAWFALGMVLLVCIGRSPSFVAKASQILSERFLPLSVFFWASLFAVAVCYGNGRQQRRSGLALPLVVFVTIAWVLISNIFLIPRIFTFRFSNQDLYISPVEIKVEALRLSLGFGESDKIRAINTLSFIDQQPVYDSLARMQTEGWDLFGKFPRLATVDEYERTTKPVQRAGCRGHVKFLRAGTRGADSMLLTGELRFDNGLPADDIVIAQGQNIIGRGFRAPIQPYANQSTASRYENLPLAAQFARSIDYVVRLLGRHSRWTAVMQKIDNLRQQPVIYYARNNSGDGCRFTIDKHGVIRSLH